MNVPTNLEQAVYLQQNYTYVRDQGQLENRFTAINWNAIEAEHNDPNTEQFLHVAEIYTALAERLANESRSESRDVRRDADAALASLPDSLFRARVVEVRRVLDGHDPRGTRTARRIAFDDPIFDEEYIVEEDAHVDGENLAEYAGIGAPQHGGDHGWDSDTSDTDACSMTE